MAIMRMRIIQKMMNSPPIISKHIKKSLICYLCGNHILYGDTYYEESQTGIITHTDCLLYRYKTHNTHIKHFGKKHELYIESPCNEIIKTMYGLITYLEYIVLEAKRLRESGRFPKIEILHNGSTCRLCIDSINKYN